jgi:hypothetical protein
MDGPMLERCFTALLITLLLLLLSGYSVWRYTGMAWEDSVGAWLAASVAATIGAFIAAGVTLAQMAN